MNITKCQWQRIAPALLFLGHLHAAWGDSQVTLADYERAQTFQNAHTLVSGVRLEPQWLDNESFWFLSEHAQQKNFIRVDPARNLQAPAFDHARLAAGLSAAAHVSYSAQALPFPVFEFANEEHALLFNIAERGWRCELQRYTCVELTQAVGARPGEVLSPNKRWAVFLRDHNLWMRDMRTGALTALTTDGIPDFDYNGHAGRNTSQVSSDLLGEPLKPTVYFAPDSRRLLTYRLDVRAVGTMQVVQTVPGGRPIAHRYPMPLVGDAHVPMAQLMVVDLAEAKATALKYPPFEMTEPERSYPWAQWSGDGKQVMFMRDERGYRRALLLLADVVSGQVREVTREESATYVDRGMQRYLFKDARRLIWTAERDGWNHLFLKDVASSKTVQLTRGEWVVRELQYVDEQHGWVYFTAGGKETDQDPYYRHLYRVKLNGTHLQHLTPEPSDHDIRFSPSGHYFIDTYSRVNAASISVIREAGGRLVRELQHADISRLVAAGWRAPEPFKVKARDGNTEIYGVMFKPTNFDARRRYPVLDSVYPGPQRISTPKSFSVQSSEEELALAELGFIVITIDGMGTPLRSKTFREVSYGDWGGGSLQDHVVGLKELAARHPYLDLTRVGIYGISGGGYASTRAMLQFPEFYKAAVSIAGNHDQRSYGAWWGERYQGFPVGDNHLPAANTLLAANLRGKLLLIHGDMDDNTPPTMTMQMANALIAANRDFDMLLLPNRNHDLVDVSKGKAAPRGLEPYVLRKRWDYFVEHLIGATPPKEFQLRLQSP